MITIFNAAINSKLCVCVHAAAGVTCCYVYVCVYICVYIYVYIYTHIYIYLQFKSLQCLTTLEF